MIFRLTKPVHYFLIITLTLALLLLLVANLASLVFAENASGGVPELLREVDTKVNTIKDELIPEVSDKGGVTTDSCDSD